MYSPIYEMTSSGISIAFIRSRIGPARLASLFRAAANSRLLGMVGVLGHFKTNPFLWHCHRHQSHPLGTLDHLHSRALSPNFCWYNRHLFGLLQIVIKQQLGLADKLLLKYTFSEMTHPLTNKLPILLRLFTPKSQLWFSYQPLYHHSSYFQKIRVSLFLFFSMRAISFFAKNSQLCIIAMKFTPT